MATLQPNAQNNQNFDLTDLTTDQVEMIQVGLIELQAKLKKEDEFHSDLKSLNMLFSQIDSELLDAVNAQN